MNDKLYDAHDEYLFLQFSLAFKNSAYYCNKIVKLIIVLFHHNCTSLFFLYTFPISFHHLIIIIIIVDFTTSRGSHSTGQHDWLNGWKVNNWEGKIKRNNIFNVETGMVKITSLFGLCQAKVHYLVGSLVHVPVEPLSLSPLRL